MISFLQLCISVRENQSPTKLLSDRKPGYWVNLLGWHVVIVTGKQIGAFITRTISISILIQLYACIAYQLQTFPLYE